MRILRHIHISPAYSIFSKIIKIRILHGYVSAAYRICIRVQYISDTRYAPILKYPCNVGRRPLPSRPLKNRSCRAARRAKVAAQARPVDRAVPDMGPGEKYQAPCGAFEPRAACSTLVPVTTWNCCSALGGPWSLRSMTHNPASKTHNCSLARLAASASPSRYSRAWHPTFMHDINACFNR